jgi:nucleotide-binding universal stress UspA family protein
MQSRKNAMPQVNHILVPIDLHDQAEPVVSWAALMARAFHSPVTLLHVNEGLESLKHHPLMQSQTFPEMSEAVTNWRKTYEQSVQAAFTRLTEQHGRDYSVTTMQLEGRAQVVILDYLEKHPTDLVVMGTHGRPWYQRMVLGSTAETVLRAAPCPVLIVPNRVNTQLLPRCKTLLVPIDFSVGGMVSEEWALQLASQEEKKVILLHAVENPLLDVYDPDKVELDLKKIMEESRLHPPRSAQPFWDHAHQVAHAKLTTMRQQFLGVHAQVELIVREGPAAEDILKTAEKREVDLIVIATHGRSGMRRLFLGSVTEKVIRSAPCPVLAVRSE